ncbi:diheme cytochrome c-553 [Arenibacter sp. TNZ]|uniref:c-type cytochrome n=1 Tax=Arenibacter TaxID=178469 RepID=UPI000CD446F6|nr:MULTISPECIES: c-type cytochrome [Arenibacter]MCM4173025.1 diheme cytochrome c-553 [Arenibacter sp. TNZ]
MKKTNFLILILLVISFAFFGTSCSNRKKNSAEDYTTVAAKSKDVVEHGEYLVTIMGCNDCHSPKRMGANGPEIIPELMLSGYPGGRPIIKFENPLIKEGFGMFYPDLTAAAGPWGVSFAGNLTPDETGIGNWTEEQFKKAITQGKLKGMDGGRNLLPPMPWLNYVSLTDQDINAIFLYLKSIKPVRNIPPPPISPDKM